jgi:hypothetical protein
MSSTIIANEAHDNHIGEIGDTCLAHFHLSRHLAGVARDIEEDRLVFHELVLVEGFSEVDFVADFFILLLF